MIPVRCCHCKKTITPGDANLRPSDGLCEPCLRKFYPQHAEAVLRRMERAK